MSDKIWKYEIIQTDYQEIEMPEGAKILSVQMQRNQVCIWVQVNPDNKPVIRKFYLRGTGHTIHVSNTKYIGTFQTMKGAFVGHLFEMIEPVQ